MLFVSNNALLSAYRVVIVPGVLFIFFFSSIALSAEDAFQKAVRINDLDTINQLASTTADIDARGTNGKTALMIAAKSGNAGLVKKLLEAGADARAENVNGGTPIMFAAIDGDIETIETLIQAGSEVRTRGSNGWSALMVAAAKGHVDATRLIINAGADINTVDIYLWTPLHRAAYENRIKVVEILLEQESIDIQLRDDHGATALHHAAGNGNTEIVRLLIAAGADSEMIDSDGRTAAIYAYDNGHHVQSCPGRRRRGDFTLGCNPDQSTGQTRSEMAWFSGRFTLLNYIETGFFPAPVSADYVRSGHQYGQCTGNTFISDDPAGIRLAK
jgi:ankyrin repeat protein